MKRLSYMGGPRPGNLCQSTAPRLESFQHSCSMPSCAAAPRSHRSPRLVGSFNRPFSPPGAQAMTATRPFFFSFFFSFLVWGGGGGFFFVWTGFFFSKKFFFLFFFFFFFFFFFLGAFFFFFFFFFFSPGPGLERPPYGPARARICCVFKEATCTIAVSRARLDAEPRIGAGRSRNQWGTENARRHPFDRTDWHAGKGRLSTRRWTDRSNNLPTDSRLNPSPRSAR